MNGDGSLGAGLQPGCFNGLPWFFPETFGGIFRVQVSGGALASAPGKRDQALRTVSKLLICNVAPSCQRSAISGPCIVVGGEPRMGVCFLEGALFLVFKVFVSWF